MRNLEKVHLETAINMRWFRAKPIVMWQLPEHIIISQMSLRWKMWRTVPFV